MTQENSTDVLGIYGRKKFGTEVKHEKFYLKLDTSYLREFKESGEKVEKIVAGGNEFIVNPVEPVNLPAGITRFLFVEFSKPVNIEPGESVILYLKFPVEVGVFVKGRRLSVIDVFTLTRPKYTLYGTPSKGIVCRYYLSDVYSTPPEVDGLTEGILELKIKNDFDDWVEVKKAVFDGYGMKIYYSDCSSMVARMKVESRTLAETTFLNAPLKDGMRKAIELYVARRLIERKKFVMEWGF